MNSPFKFLRRVRIHGGECGAVARALHHEAQKVALTQNEQSLISDECVLLRQADSGKALGSTFNERKQMSTKTSIKRIALIAVSALGFGLVTSVGPVNAAATQGTLSVTQSTTGRLNAPVVLKVSHSITTDGTVSSNDTATIKVKLLTSAPGSSALDGDNMLFHDWTSDNLQSKPSVVLTTGGPNIAADAAITVDNSTSNDLNSIIFDCENTSTACAADTTYSLTAYASWIPDKAGTWNWAFWEDNDGDGVLDAAEKTSTISVVVSDSAIKSVTVTSVGGTAPTTASSTAEATAENGLMKIRFTGSDDLPAILTTSEFASATVSAGSMYINKLNDDSATYSEFTTGSLEIGEAGGSGVTSININYYNVDIFGNVYLDVKNATEETASLTVTVGGTTISGSANQVFVTASDDTHSDGILCKVTTTAGCLESGATDPSFTIGVGTKSVTYYVGTDTAEGEAAVDITDTSGLITGFVGADFSKVVVGSDTEMTAAQVTAIGFTTSNYLASFSVTSTSGSVTGGTYALLVEDNGSQTATVAAGTATTGALYYNGVAKDTVRAAKGSSNSMTFRCTDDLGARKANATVTLSLTGRNAGLVTLPTLVTNSSGEAVLTYTDASTSTSTTTDTIVFTTGSCTDTAYFTFYSTADLGVDTITWTAGGAYDESYAGAIEDNIQADDDAATGSETMTFLVKDASGVALAGVPVVFTVDSGNVRKTATIDYGTVLTGADGKASTAIFVTKPGKQTVTATVGSKTQTGYVNWVQEEEDDARSIAVAASGNKVTFTVKDRFGNGVQDVDVTVKTNDGWFGSGSTSTTAITAADGTAVVYLSGNSAEATVTGTLPRASYPQAYDVAGEIAETAVTAAVAGTTTGFGAADAAAGVAEVTVKVSAGSDAGTVAANAAADAAAEAIDAANAATDAANLAAEAADAATVAAEEARDAADAATAAVEELATQVATLMAALKAQITTLANTVAKIAKKVKA